MIDKTAVGKHIYTLRKKLGITQEQLSQLLSVTPQAISKWENGATLPDIDLLPQLAATFGISVGDLLCVAHPPGSSSQKAQRVTLSGLKHTHCFPPLISCVRSSLQYLGVFVSPAWLSATYAFMLNINREVSPKGPEYWSDPGFLNIMIANSGGICEDYCSSRKQPTFHEDQAKAWKLVRDAIDKGLPCYAWELNGPEYSMIAGYDETGYYYLDRQGRPSQEPVPWGDLGNTDWGVLEIHIIRPGSISDNLKTVKDILEYAVGVGNVQNITNPGYTAGLEAYRVWWEAVEGGTADPVGMVVNTEFWSQCKVAAVRLLQEAKLRVGTLEAQFDLAIRCYERVVRDLEQLDRQVKTSSVAAWSPAVRTANAALLKSAQCHESQGVEALRNLLNMIYEIW